MKKGVSRGHKMKDVDLIKKYKTNFLGSVLILKIQKNNTIILENYTFKINQSYLRILKDNFQKDLSKKEKILLLLKSARSGINDLNSISFLTWHEMRLV